MTAAKVDQQPGADQPTTAEPPTGADRPTGTEQPTGAEQPTGPQPPTSAQQPTGAQRPTGTQQPTGTQPPTSAEQPTGAEELLAADEIRGIRVRIDEIDQLIIDLWQERSRLSQQVGKTRMASGGTRLVLSREREIVERFRIALGPDGTQVALLLLRSGRGPL